MAAIDDGRVPLRRGHAVVLGASMGGLLAARILSERFDRVSVVERDDLSGPGDRRGVPQGKHVHALLAGGKRNVEALFPGITAELLADGAVDCRSLTEMRMSISGHTLCQSDGGYSLLQASRPFLEWRVRQRVRASANVEILDRHTVHGLLTDPAHTEVTGVEVEVQADGSRRKIHADLVVSCLGRHGPIIDWLTDMGYERPAEEGVRIDMMYASRYLRLPEGSVAGDKEIIVANQDPARGLALFAIEDGMHILTLIGYGRDHPPTDDEGYWRFAASVAPPDVQRALLQAEPHSAISTYRYLANQRRRYERLTRFPLGLLVFGDAVCSFSPAFGQGMTVSSMQAMRLRQVLTDGDHDLARRFFDAAADAIDDAWMITRLFDLAMPHVDADPRMRALGSLTQLAVAIGAREAAVGRQISRIAGLLDRPHTILRPDLLARMARGTAALTVEALRRRGSVAGAREPIRFDPLPLSRARGFHLLTVASVTRDISDAAIIELAVPAALADRYRFTAGQHVAVRGRWRGQPVRRNYSLCDAPEEGRVRIAVKRRPGGAFSEFALDHLAPGTTLHVSEPMGTFTATPRPEHSRRYAAVAAGSGITPIASIIASILTGEPGSSFTLHYGSRDQHHIMLATHLDALVDRFGDRLSLRHYLSRPHPAHLPPDTAHISYRRGRIDPTDLASLDADQWYLCGPGPLVRAGVEMLTGRGITREHIHLELFDTHHSEPVAAQADTSPCTITLSGHGEDLVYTMPRNGAILAAALGEREDLPYSCLGGSCGTCLASVQSGRVEMDSDPLLAISDADIAAGKVLACRTRPVSDAVTLRFEP
ncbi:2Fe-2S iron-sulfur cluster-binding protein [Nocardia beijingensis]|uniref:2Fe-2S iron-sulfur cluster-binding protein n=1 Tax=Nocardia beijingensis TaxID=95162 RepID=UPI00332CC15B